MDPFRFLKTRSEEERVMMQAIAHAARSLERERDLERANMIANQVGKLFGGG